ncbi:hypothetical protein [Pseudoalteromonas sp. 1181_04]|uniref:hypothetical protein n=1 Tax=Pseudoalteromonas sp. 1181_04 TaxID=2604450 RepID=UPI004063E1C0
MKSLTKTNSAISLDAKALVAALAIESFNFRENVSVNVVTNAQKPFIDVFVYINDVSVESFMITLTDDDAVEQLQVAFDKVRDYKKQDKSFAPLIKLAS